MIFLNILLFSAEKWDLILTLNSVVTCNFRKIATWWPLTLNNYSQSVIDGSSITFIPDCYIIHTLPVSFIPTMCHRMFINFSQDFWYTSCISLFCPSVLFLIFGHWFKFLFCLSCFLHFVTFSSLSLPQFIIYISCFSMVFLDVFYHYICPGLFFIDPWPSLL